MNYSVSVTEDGTVNDTVNCIVNVTNVTDNVTDVINNNTSIDEYIVASIKSDLMISTSKIAESLNVSKRTILRHIDELKKKNVLRFEKKKKNGYWELINEPRDDQGSTT